MEVKNTLAILTRIKAGDKSAREICRRTGISYGATLRLLERLEENGFIGKRPIVERPDRQRNEYWLKEKGEKYLRNPPAVNQSLF